MDGIIDTSNTYLFKSRQTGNSLVLAVSSSTRNGDKGPGLAMLNNTAADPSGQWFLTRVNGNQPGIFYRVHVASLGVGQSLDVVNEGGAVNSTRLTMSPSDNNSGQAWRFDRWSDKDTDGYRLSNKFTGPDMHLDLAAGTLDVRLFGGDFAGQHWTLDTAGGSPEPDGGDGTGGDGSAGSGRLLTTEGIIGLSVVAALGLGLGVFGLVFWLFKTRSRSRRRAAAAAQPPAELSTEAAAAAAAAAAYYQFQRKASMQSFHSAETYTMHQMPKPPPVPATQEPEAVSPESTFLRGTIPVVAQSTGMSGKTVAVEQAEPAELPDKAYE